MAAAATTLERRRRALVPALAGALLLSLAPSAADQASSPRRIISLVPAVTEILFAIGAGDRVVGVSSYDRYPPEAATRPSVGALVDPDFERIVSLRPDLVVAYGTQDDLIARLERARLPVFPYEHAGLADVTRTIRRVGERVGRTVEARALAERIDADLRAIAKRVSGRPRPSAVLLFGREIGTLRSIYASAGVGFLHDLLELAGARDVFADVPRQSLQVTTETLLARRPEVIIEVYPAEGWTPERIAREKMVWQGLPSLPAVRDGRIYVLADDRLSVPGPRVAEAARLLADVIQPVK